MNIAQSLKFKRSLSLTHAIQTGVLVLDAIEKS